MEDRIISSNIRWINLILTVMIVSMHSSCGYLVSNHSIDVFFRFINIPFDLAVPLFFLISIFLFYWKNAESIYDCKVKLFHRVKSVLVPFFLFSTIATLMFYAVNLVNVLMQGGIADYSLSRFISDVWGAQYDPPIWFLKTLFELQVMSCILFVLARKRKIIYIFFSIVTLLLNLFIKTSYSSPFFWLPIMGIGMWLAFDQRLNKLRQSKVKPWILFIAIIIVVPCCFIIFNIGTGDRLYYLYRILGSCIFGLFLMSIGLNNKSLPQVSQYSFFIFMLHVPVLSGIRKFLWLLFKGLGTVGCIITFILTIILTFAVISLLGVLLKKKAHMLWKILNGDR